VSAEPQGKGTACTLQALTGPDDRRSPRRLRRHDWL